VAVKQEMTARVSEMRAPVHKGTVLTLLVEANGLVRFKLTGALEQEGYGVLWASTVEEAVKAYERYHIDLLLLDFNRPLKEECDVFERLSALNCAMPIVILTRHKSEFDQAMAERVGAILQKPIRVCSLIHTMNMLLGRPAPPSGRIALARNPSRIMQLEANHRTAEGADRKPKGSQHLKQKVLLVDDDHESLLPSLRHSLSTETHEIVLAKNVQHVPQKSQRRPRQNRPQLKHPRPRTMAPIRRFCGSWSHMNTLLRTIKIKPAATASME
jgi:CheY-like chemotaxis protein